MAVNSLFKQSGFQHMLIDLDDTLYRQHTLFELVSANIQRYMVEKFGIPESQVPDLCRTLYQCHGTTMAGLMANGYKLDVDDWHKEVHDTLDYQQLLSKDLKTRELLGRLNLSKHILTNADARHAVKCLHQLGLSDCFHNIFCFENVQELAQKAGLISASTPVLCKPSRQVYQIVMEQIGAQPSETIFIDDSPRNIAAAHELGIFTVLVSDKVGVPHHVSGADLVVSHFSQLPEMFPDIFAPITNAAIHEEVPSIVPIKVMAS